MPRYCKVSASRPREPFALDQPASLPLRLCGKALDKQAQLAESSHRKPVFAAEGIDSNEALELGGAIECFYVGFLRLSPMF